MRVAADRSGIAVEQTWNLPCDTPGVLAQSSATRLKVFDATDQSRFL